MQDEATQADLVSGVPRFSLEERESRWRRVRTFMRAEGLDAVFVPPNTGLWDTLQANVRYLTGIGGNCAQAAAVFPLSGEVTAITSPDVEPRYWRARQEWVSDIRPVTTGWGYAGTAIERLRELGLGRARIGVTGLSGNTRFPEGITSMGIFNRLTEALPGARFVNANLMMERARFVKSDEELAFMRKAGELVERAIDVLCDEARPGVPENHVYARMISSIVEAGGELPTMILWSAGWPQPPSNQYMPSFRKICSGDMICTEAEARWAGYCAQNTQPLFVGSAPDEYRRMFEIQQEAIASCYELLRPGTTIRELLERTKSFSNDDYDCRLIMHARGLGDDSPIAVFDARDGIMADWVIEESSTFIVKPMVRTKDNLRRIYWGDTVVATSGGAKRLGKRTAEILEIK